MGAIDFEAAARGGIDAQHIARQHPRRRLEYRALAGLGQVDVGGQHAKRRQLCRREAAKTVERLHAVELEQALFAGVGVAERRGLRLQHAAALTQDGVKLFVLQNAFGNQAFGGPQRRKMRRQRARIDFQAFDVAGRQLHRCQGHDAAARSDRDQPIGAAVFEQAVLGQGTGRNDANNAAFDHGLGAAFLGLGRIFELLADGDAKPQPDQLGDIGIDRMRRHAGQRDIIIAKLAALGQGQRQGAGSGDGVVEEQLVEVAHAEEQQGIGMLGLGLQVLRHDGRSAVPLVVRGAGLIIGKGKSGGHMPKLTFLKLW